MRDVLAYCGMDVDAYANGKRNVVGTKNPLGEQDNQMDWHAHFESYDVTEVGEPYEGSPLCPLCGDWLGNGA